MTASYDDRFASELSSLLPDDVEVSADHGMIVITRGAASVPMFTPGGDRRRSVETSEARAFLADAARKLSREIPKYREQFKAPARDLVEILRHAADAVAPVTTP